MAMTEVETSKGHLEVFDFGGMLVAGEFGRNLDRELHPDQYDEGGRVKTEAQVGSLAVEATITDQQPLPDSNN